MSRNRKPVLPGLSRSAACLMPTSAGTTCGRLTGHKGAHRPTLSARTDTATPKGLDAALVQSLLGLGFSIEDAVAFVKAHPVTAPTARRPKAARRSTKPKAACRISKDGVRCDRAYGHKAEGRRHRFPGRVVNLPEGESRRMVADSSNGAQRTARRAKAAPRISAEA